MLSIILYTYQQKMLWSHIEVYMNIHCWTVLDKWKNALENWTESTLCFFVKAFFVSRAVGFWCRAAWIKWRYWKDNENECGSETKWKRKEREKEGTITLWLGCKHQKVGACGLLLWIWRYCTEQTQNVYMTWQLIPRATARSTVAASLSFAMSGNWRFQQLSWTCYTQSSNMLKHWLQFKHVVCLHVDPKVLDLRIMSSAVVLLRPCCPINFNSAVTSISGQLHQSKTITTSSPEHMKVYSFRFLAMYLYF